MPKLSVNLSPVSIDGRPGTGELLGAGGRSGILTPSGSIRSTGGTSRPHQSQSPPGSFTVTVLIASLLFEGSVRQAGYDQEHIELLVALPADELPPILVRWPTNQVIDGAHRVQAALRRGEKSLQARYVDCGEDDAFLMAVELNTRHGLPLSLADRESAAQRIMRSHQEWSDRRIGAAVGLSARTVAGMRQRSTAQNPQLNIRVGLDGRPRPLRGADGRRRAADFIAANPSCTLREIARHAGVSIGTARDVRSRISNGMNILPPRQRRGEEQEPGAAQQKATCGDAVLRQRAASWSGLRERLAKDPALKYTPSGREFLRWIDNQITTLQLMEKYIRQVPPRWSEDIACLAKFSSAEWLRMASLLADAERGDQRA